MSAKSFGKYPGALIHAEIYYWQLSNNADNEQLPILQFKQIDKICNELSHNDIRSKRILQR